MEKRSKTLNLDLLSEILSRIPVRSLLQWRCVSKSWRALIDDPVFARLHLTHSNNTSDETCLFVVQETSRGQECVVRCSKALSTLAYLAMIQVYPDSSHTLPTLSINHDGCGGGDDLMWYYCSSVDGLIMLVEIVCKNDLMLWNPSIRKTRRVPPCPEISAEMIPVHFGLGFDPLCDDYKHVILVHSAEWNLQFFAIYTVGSNSWKTTEFQHECVGGEIFGFSPRNDATVCVGGVLYDLCGVSFDLRTETFAFIRYPEDPKLLVRCESLTTADCGRVLALVQFTDVNGYIHVLQQGIWTQRNKFPVVVPKCGLTRIMDTPYLLYLMKNGEVLLDWRTVVTSNCIETGEQRILLEENWSESTAQLYKESLLLLN